MNLKQLGIEAKRASKVLANLSTQEKNRILFEMAKSLKQSKTAIIDANKKDINWAKEKGLTRAMIDRLLLDDARVLQMAKGLMDICDLQDPVGVGDVFKRPNGLTIVEQRVPIGVIGIIYEARPNVTSDAAGLCIKAGNSVILRGGSEAIYSNRSIVKALKYGIQKAGVDDNIIQLVESTDRESVKFLMQMDDYIDVLIPRGGAGLIKTVSKNSKVPVIITGEGNCHIYIDRNADFKMAKNIIINAKTSRPSVCNAVETVLVHKDISRDFLPEMLAELSHNDVKIYGCEKTCEIYPDAKRAMEDDWSCEYLDLVVAVKVVESLDEAIDHINTYGTLHSEAIITENYNSAKKFLREIDAACVYVNSSTRFTDGGEFGFGAEIGISTQKLHARGPMGLKELTCKKYLVLGEGQIRT